MDDQPLAGPNSSRRRALDRAGTVRRRSRRGSRRLAGVAAATAAALLAPALVATVAEAQEVGGREASATEPAGTDGSRPPDLQGSCEVEARVGSAVVVPARSGGVYTLPLAADVVYDARLGSAVVDESGGTAPRSIEGEVRLRLPWPLGSATITSWDEPLVSGASESGSFGYELDPRWAPIGAVVTVDVDHRDGEDTCSGSVTARLAGGFLDGLVRPAAAVVTALGLLAVLAAGRPRRRAGDVDAQGLRHGFGTSAEATPVGDGPLRARGRPVVATIAGAVTGLAVAVDLVLASVVAFEGPTMAVTIVLGALAGWALGWWAPVRSRRGGGPPGPEEPELVTLDLASPPGPVDAPVGEARATDPGDPIAGEPIDHGHGRVRGASPVRRRGGGPGAG